MARYYNTAMFSIQVGVLVLLALPFAHQTDVLSVEEQLRQLTENYIKIADVWATKAARLEELESKVIRLDALEVKVEQQREMIAALQQQIDGRSSNKIPDLIHTVAATGMPKSCADLRYMGHSANGFYLIMGTEKMETAYCDFSALPSDPKFQTWIGELDVKSKAVYFYVQRSTNFNTANTPIPFEVEKINIGNAMDLASGKFTAPRAGTYFFSFTGLAGIPTSSERVGLGVYMYLNGIPIEKAYADELDGQLETISLQSTLDLQAGDQIWLRLDPFAGTFLFEDGSCGKGGTFDGNCVTHFNGWLLNENLSQSLIIE